MEMDLAYLFNLGKNYMSYNMLGSKPGTNAEGEQGYRFAVWAPNAKKVCVVGDFNEWQEDRNKLEPYGATGIWIGFIPDLEQWERYKYGILTQNDEWILKADPYARHAETRPGTASILYDPDDYIWQDQEYMANRVDAYELSPLNIYEVHLGSWRRYEDGSVYNYRDISDQLADYVLEMGYNAIELMPISEYPLDASWGYQVSGYYAVTSRYGTPADLKYFVDHMHQKGIHVFLDWVPAHFPKDAFGLAKFDGEAVYEYANPLLGEHEDWGTLVFDFSKGEVRSFLLSNAYFWLDEFHFDGLRVDAVSSMIYRDYSRSEYIPNIHGGNENLEAISLLQELNTIVRENFPGAITMAEESTAFPYMTTGVDQGGIGFIYKWNMGWMNDTLYFNSLDHYQREFHHNAFTFSMVYAFSERYILPFSHDEVVHGKGTLIGRMAGDYWRQFANLRAIYTYQIAHPGAKLNFMGNEFAPFTEWRYYEELEWFMLEYPAHNEIHRFVKTLNHLYLDTPALWEEDNDWHGFKWIQADDSKNSVFAFLRFNSAHDEAILCVLNMTPGVVPEYTLTMPFAGEFELILNSDDEEYGGSNYLGGFDNKRIYQTYEYKVYSESAVNELYELEESDESDESEELLNKSIKIKLKDKSDDLKQIKTADQIADQQVDPDPESPADHSDDQIDESELFEIEHRLDIVMPPLCGMLFKWNKEDEKKE